MTQIRTTCFLVVIAILVCVGSWWPSVSNAQAINQFDWIKPLPGEPIGTSVDGQRNTYVLTSGNTLIEFDTRGRERWRQTFGTWPALTQLTTDRAGNLLVSGSFTSSATVGDSTFTLPNTYTPNTFVAKLDSTHRLMWARQVPGPDYLDYAAGLKTDSLGYIHLLGARVSGPMLVQIDPAGQYFDKKSLFLLIQPSPLPTSFDTDADGNVIATLTQVGRLTSLGMIQKISPGGTVWSHYVDEGLPASLGTYSTNAIQVGLDSKRAGYVLSNYSLPDPTSGKTLETGQALLKLDATGNRVWQKSGPTVADSAQAQGLLVDPAGAAITYGAYPGKFIAGSFPARYSTDDYIGLTEYAPTGEQRWTTHFGSATGNDKLYRVARDANGALLVTASTTGPLTLGTLTLTGTADAPTFYLAKLQPAQLRPDSTRTVLCLGSNVTLPGKFTGYFDQDLVIQLSDVAGRFDNPTPIGRIPINTPGSYFPGPVTPPVLTLPPSVSAGIGYRIRVVSAVPVYSSEPMAITVNVAPTQPLIAQVGDDFISNAPTGNQWFTAAKQPIAGATNAHYKPAKAGQYCVVATVNGCPSPPSELLTYLITAVEPVRPAADLLIYPNPATDRIRVEWTGVATGVTAEVMLYDATGKLCRRVSRASEATDLWLTDLSAGSYLVSVQVEGKPINSRRLLIR